MDGHDAAVRTADDVRVEQSHVNDDPEDADCQSTANDGVTDYENDDPSNFDDAVIESTSPSDDQLMEVASGLLAVNNGDGSLVDGAVPDRLIPADKLMHERTAEFVLVDNMARQEPVDGNHEALSKHLPVHHCISPDEDFDDRDPNYATERPDTLGAINVTAAAAAAFAGPVARHSYPVAAAVKSWPVDSAAEDATFADNGTAHLGRRTCGAGMDQLELNQRQLMDSDLDEENGASDGSDLCDDDDDNDDDDDDDDAGLGNGNQCESTEADQYKMDPEADQSAAAVEILSSGRDHLATDLQENDGVLFIADNMRRGFSLAQRRQTDGALSDLSHSMDDPEEDQADRVISVDGAKQQSAAALQKPSDAACAVPMYGEQKRAPLKQHPQSAFSIPKPRVTKSKPKQPDSAIYSNRPVPSVRQSKSKTDIVFKPITTSLGNTNSVPRTVMTCKGADGLSFMGTLHGELPQYSVDKGQLSVQDSIDEMTFKDKIDAGGNVEPHHHHHHHPSKPLNPATVRSTWSRESLWNNMDQPVVAWNNAHMSSSISLQSACHLPGECGATAVGMFAPPSSCSQQATPEKTGTHACCELNNSLDMSPIQPVSSCSRPLSVNGLHAVVSAPVNVFPSTEFYFGTQGSPLQYSHKVTMIAVLQLYF